MTPARCLSHYCAHRADDMAALMQNAPAGAASILAYIS